MVNENKRLSQPFFSPIQPFALLINSATIHSRGHVTRVWSKKALASFKQKRAVRSRKNQKPQELGASSSADVIAVERH